MVHDLVPMTRVLLYTAGDASIHPGLNSMVSFVSPVRPSNI